MITSELTVIFENTVLVIFGNILINYTCSCFSSIVQKRTFTIYIGSAHSQFENKLPAGEARRLRNLQPLSATEATKLVSVSSNPVGVLQSDRSINQSNQSINQSTTESIVH